MHYFLTVQVPTCIVLYVVDTQATERCLQVDDMADRVPHEGYLRHSWEHVAHESSHDGGTPGIVLAPT